MSIHIDHTGAFAAFWNREFPGMPCPPVPKKESDLTMTARETLRVSDPVLFQNMFARSTASLQLRHASSSRVRRDAPHVLEPLLPECKCRVVL